MTGIVTYHVVICFGGDDIEEVSLATSIANVSPIKTSVRKVYLKLFIIRKDGIRLQMYKNSLMFANKMAENDYLCSQNKTKRS